jgi:hypothetical protein
MFKSGIFIVCLLVGVFGCSDSGEDVAGPDENRVSLFDGVSLGGWTVLGCEAVVDGGDILLVSGNGLVQTEKMYGDFVLDFEWKALADEKYDSGVYFRYDSVPEGQPWPKYHQVNLKQGQEGNCGSLKGARSSGLYKPGQWNQFKIVVDGVKVSVEINGKPAWSAEGLRGPATGYIALQAEVPAGGQHRFKNIFVTEKK